MQDEKRLEINLRAEELQDYVFRITSKKPRVKKSKDGVLTEPEEYNGLPAKYRYSIGTRMQDYSIDLLLALEDARYEKDKRVEHLDNALRILRRLNSCIWLCFRNRIITKQSAEYGEKLLLNVKYMAIAWRNKSRS